MLDCGVHHEIDTSPDWWRRSRCTRWLRPGERRSGRSSPHRCAADAIQQAQKLLVFHFGADDRIEIDKSARGLAPTITRRIAPSASTCSRWRGDGSARIGCGATYAQSADCTPPWGRRSEAQGQFYIAIFAARGPTPARTHASLRRRADRHTNVLGEVGKESRNRDAVRSTACSLASPVRSVSSMT